MASLLIKNLFTESLSVHTFPQGTLCLYQDQSSQQMLIYNQLNYDNVSI